MHITRLSGVVVLALGSVTLQPTQAQARTPSALTLSIDRALITAGNAPKVFGTLTDGHSRPVRNRAVTITKEEWNQTSYSVVGVVTTDAQGHYELAVRPTVQTRYGAQSGDLRAPYSILVLVHVRIIMGFLFAPGPCWHSPLGITATTYPATPRIPIGVGSIPAPGLLIYLGQAKTDAGGKVELRWNAPAGSLWFAAYTPDHSGQANGSTRFGIPVCGKASN